MNEKPENVRRLLVQLVPAAIISEITCFVFYDSHPRDDKQIDVTICTKTGELREYYQRDQVFSIQLNDMERPAEIKILRNNDGQLFYLVRAGDQLTIVSRKESLQVIQTVNNVDRYDVIDLSCSGTASLSIVKKDDAFPLTFDDNFENILRPDLSQTFTELNDDDSLPMITHLKRKLTEAKYSVCCNEKHHQELLSLRQMAAYSMYQKMYPNLDDSVIKGGIKEMSGALKIVSEVPWVKVSNKKLVIVYTVCNKNKNSLSNVHFLLHGTTRPSLTYTTKLFENTNKPQFWMENHTQIVQPNKETAVVTVLALNEIKYNVTSKIQFNGLIFYTNEGKECVLPLDSVEISSLDTLGKDFNVLSCEDLGSREMLALLATSVKTDLIVRHIKNEDDKDFLRIDLFRRYLNMQVCNAGNIVIHKNSPYHVLNGVMIIVNCEERNRLAISVYSSSPSQVLALVHYIHDAIPLTIITTPTSYKITSKHHSTHNEEIPDETTPEQNYLGYASSIQDRCSMILDYLNNSMIKMNESKNPVVQNRVGTEIDLLADGPEAYLELRSKMSEKALDGVSSVII